MFSNVLSKHLEFANAMSSLFAIASLVIGVYLLLYALNFIHGDMMSEKNNRKTIFKIFALIVLLFGAWWLTYGGGRMTRHNFFYKNFGVYPPGMDETHGLAMTHEQNIEFMRRALPTDEFAIWKANWDYEHGEWKGRTAEEIQKMKAEFYEWREQHDQMLREDYKAYRKKYAPLFGEVKDMKRFNSEMGYIKKQKCAEGEEFIEAVVMLSDVYPSPGMDCFQNARGCLDGQKTFLAKMKALDAEKMNEGDEFHIYTKLLPAVSFFEQQPYMQTGKTYSFCAQKVDSFEFIDKRRQTEEPKYKINFVNSIYQSN